MESIKFLSFYLSLHTSFDLHVPLLGFQVVPRFEEENCRNLYCTSSNIDLRSVPLLSPFNYAEWKLYMVSYIERNDIRDVSFGAGKESYEC